MVLSFNRSTKSHTTNTNLVPLLAVAGAKRHISKWFTNKTPQHTGHDLVRDLVKIHLTGHCFSTFTQLKWFITIEFLFCHGQVQLEKYGGGRRGWGFFQIKVVGILVVSLYTSSGNCRFCCHLGCEATIFTLKVSLRVVPKEISILKRANVVKVL